MNFTRTVARRTTGAERGGHAVGIPQMLFAPWVRKHDKPGVPLIPQAASTIFPQSLADLIEICRTRQPGQHLHAAGSHWALSTAAVSDHTFIETHDPNDMQSAMGRTLYNVVPGCLADEFLTVLNEQTNNPALAAGVTTRWRPI